MREGSPAQPPRFLVIIPRSRAVEGVALMDGFGGLAEMIIDRRVFERRRRPCEWPEFECRRRKERRCSDSEGGNHSVIFAS